MNPFLMLAVALCVPPSLSPAEGALEPPPPLPPPPPRPRPEPTARELVVAVRAARAEVKRAKRRVRRLEAR